MRQSSYGCTREKMKGKEREAQELLEASEFARNTLPEKYFALRKRKYSNLGTAFSRENEREYIVCLMQDRAINFHWLCCTTNN